MNGPFEGGCRLQSGAGAWLACNTSARVTMRRSDERRTGYRTLTVVRVRTPRRVPDTPRHMRFPRDVFRASLSRARALSLSLSRVIHARSLPLHESGHGFVFCPKKGQRPERLGVLKS